MLAELNPSAYQAMLKVRKVEPATDLVFVTKGPLLQITSDQTWANLSKLLKDDA